MRHGFDGKEGTVERYEVPGVHAINLVSAAPVGRPARLARLDALAKGMASSCWTWNWRCRRRSTSCPTHSARKGQA
jgi:hypothetical protein